MAFLKSEKPKQFTYIPIFYDKQKEELNERIKQVQKEMDKSEDGQYTPNFKGQFKRRHEAFYGQPVKKSRNMSRWLTLIIYAGLVVAIVYLVLNIMTYLQ